MRALATSLAGDQLERLQAAGHTARREWRAGRGAKDVAMQVTAYKQAIYYTRGARGSVFYIHGSPAAYCSLLTVPTASY